MAFVVPTDDIILQEGTFAFSFEASGAISGGSLVKPAGPMFVVKGASGTDNTIGVAAYSVAKNDMVAVYGPGNIVRTYSPSSVKVASGLCCTVLGGVHCNLPEGETFVKVGTALETISAAGTVRVLLK